VNHGEARIEEDQLWFNHHEEYKVFLSNCTALHYLLCGQHPPDLFERLVKLAASIIELEGKIYCSCQFILTVQIIRDQGFMI
jgi:hypothetical protein